MDKDNGGIVPIKPKFMSAEILVDWEKGMVLIQEKSVEGLPLINPITFVFPIDVYLTSAASLTIERIRRDQQRHSQMRIVDGKGKPTGG